MVQMGREVCLFLAIISGGLFISLVAAGGGDWNILNHHHKNRPFNVNVNVHVSGGDGGGSHSGSLKNYCESWRMNVEMNNIRGFEVVSEEYIDFIGKYMTSSQYKADSERAIEESSLYLSSCCSFKGDGKDAWIFHIDDTLLSTLPYFKKHHFGKKKNQIGALSLCFSVRPLPLCVLPLNRCPQSVPTLRQIVSASRDRSIKLWNTLGECKYTIRDGDAHSDWVSCVRFSPNNLQPTIVSSSWDRTVKIWKLTNCKIRASLAGHSGYVNTVAMLPNGSLCASGGKDGVILLWDLAEGKRLYSLDSGSIINMNGVATSKKDGFSLSSGDFPTLGSEKDNSGKSPDSQGPIPSELGSLTSLLKMNLQSNGLIGKLLSELGNLKYLEELRLDRNKLQGNVPATNNSDFTSSMHGIQELEVACEDFSNIIGSSPDNLVYKGAMKGGPEIAVISLCIKEEHWTGYLELYYQREVADLARLNHENTGKLLGYCTESKPFTRMLVFEYASNGTLLYFGQLKAQYPAREALFILFRGGDSRALSPSTHLSSEEWDSELVSSSLLPDLEPTVDKPAGGPHYSSDSLFCHGRVSGLPCAEIHRDAPISLCLAVILGKRAILRKVADSSFAVTESRKGA
ncbi:hypothetical protein HYC85_020976 [Camellia sinensis]|uniref:Protein kinase domain-containing protein n=1 Tax=Camellia sinensis TaxID=4442 RepID=A0A7J7GGB2_CAMSI|nr:hypothetical protein HYC85_020976 [Camellia sinensis]